MKRFFLTALAATITGMALAQAPFTIVRPADGSKVREDVHILFPKNSVPDGGYVGIWVNGQFIEAVVPQNGAKFMDYTLHTKTLNLPDGPTTIEAVLYVDFEEKPRIVDRSSIQVTMSNRANIPVPDNGFLLRYRWHNGEALTYQWDSDFSVSNISESQAKLGGHAAETGIEGQSARIVYNVDNVYPTPQGQDALLRITAQPPAGKNSVMLSSVQDPFPKLYYANQMDPIYMRVQDTGKEVFGQLPQFFFDFPGLTASNSSFQRLIGLFPLPTLPDGRVRPGDSWQTRFQMGRNDLATINLLDSAAVKIPARGEFEGLEWEMGSPCAKLHRTIAVGSGGGGVGANKIKDNAEEIDETCWFALDRGEIIKIVRTETLDRKIDTAPAAGANGSTTGGPGGVPPGKLAGMIGSSKGPGGGGGGAAAGAPGRLPGNRGNLNVPLQDRQGGIPPGKMAGMLGSSAGPSGGGRLGQGRNGGTAQAPPPSVQLVRVQLSETYTLVK